jgi:hypothetical protein
MQDAEMNNTAVIDQRLHTEQMTNLNKTELNSSTERRRMKQEANSIELNLAALPVHILQSYKKTKLDLVGVAGQSNCCLQNYQ